MKRFIEQITVNNPDLAYEIVKALETSEQRYECEVYGNDPNILVLDGSQVPTQTIKVFKVEVPY